MLQITRPISWILEGQSNAAGAEKSFNAQEELKGTQKGCYIYSHNRSKWEPYQIGINSWNTDYLYADLLYLENFDGGSFGIEGRLNQLINKYYGADVYLNKYGWPSSGLQTTGQGGTWNPATSNNCFSKSNSKYQASRVPSKLIDPDPDFYVWIQGEGDAALSATYGAALTDFITQKRNIYGYIVPFIIVSLSNQQTLINSTQITNMKNVQKSLAQYVYTAATQTFTTQSGGSVITDVYCVDQNEVCGSDNIHYNATGLYNIANHVFECVKKIVK